MSTTTVSSTHRVGATHGFSAPSSTGQVGAQAALRSAQALGSDAGEGLGKKLQKGVTAALVGVTLMTSLSAPVLAQETTANLQPTELVMSHPATGPPGGLHFGDIGVAGGVGDSTITARQNFDRFLGAVPQNAPRQEQLAVDARTKSAIDAFAGRLTQIMHQDAASLAWGHTPTQFGDQLSPHQEEQAMDALRTLLEELPVGAYGPGVENALEKVTGALGSDVDLATVRLKDVPRAGGDAIKDLLKEMRREHPGSFWALAGAVAGGVGYLGYTEGTDALKDLGIRPEISTRFFNKSMRLRVGVEAGPKFSDPVATVGLSGQHTFDNGVVWQGGVKARMGSAFEGGQVTSTITAPNQQFTATGTFNFDGQGNGVDARLSVQTRIDRWHVGGEAAYTFENDRFTTSLAAGRTFDINQKNDLDLQFRASTDNRGESQVGVGLTFRW